MHRAPKHTFSRAAPGCTDTHARNTYVRTRAARAQINRFRRRLAHLTHARALTRARAHTRSPHVLTCSPGLYGHARAQHVRTRAPHARELIGSGGGWRISRTHARAHARTRSHALTTRTHVQPRAVRTRTRATRTYARAPHARELIGSGGGWRISRTHLAAAKKSLV